MIWLTTIVLSLSLNTAIPDGQLIFIDNCMRCHYPSNDAVPSLSLACEERTEEYLINFISNENKFRKTDKTAKAVTKKWKSIMPKYDFSEEEMSALLEYICAGN